MPSAEQEIDHAGGLMGHCKDFDFYSEGQGAYEGFSGKR